MRESTREEDRSRDFMFVYMVISSYESDQGSKELRFGGSFLVKVVRYLLDLDSRKTILRNEDTTGRSAHLC